MVNHWSTALPMQRFQAFPRELNVKLMGLGKDID
jgi:hypothetical protein